MTPEEEPWEPWIETEIVRDPVSPWAVAGFGWCLLMALLTVAVLLR